MSKQIYIIVYGECDGDVFIQRGTAEAIERVVERQKLGNEYALIEGGEIVKGFNRKGPFKTFISKVWGFGCSTLAAISSAR